MLKDCALKYYDPKNDLSCSETLLHAANEYYDLHLPPSMLKASSAFGAGMYYDEVCGACSSCVAVIGTLLSNGSAHKSDDMRAAVKEMMSRFHEELHDHYCGQLKERYQTEEKRCEKMIVTAADLLEDILHKYGRTSGRIDS